MLQTRRGQPADAPMLAELAGRLFRDAFARDNTPEDMREYLSQHFTEAALAAVLSDSACHVLVLEEAGAPVGWALLVTGPSAPRSADRSGAPQRRSGVGPEVEIRRFYVDASHHGGEAATVLMRAALDQARALGADGLWLAVWERNARAQVFYAKHGFRRVGAQAFQFGGDTQTDDVLARPLSFGVSLAIVAGGSATRLGGLCKPLLRVRGRTVLERLLALGTLADEVLLVSADPRLPDAGLRQSGGRAARAWRRRAGCRRRWRRQARPGCSRWRATCPSSTAARCFRCSRRAGTTWTRWPTPWPDGSSLSPRCTAARSLPAGRPRSPGAAPRSARSGVGCAA